MSACVFKYSFLLLDVHLIHMGCTRSDIKKRQLSKGGALKSPTAVANELRLAVWFLGRECPFLDQKAIKNKLLFGW